MYPPPLSLSLIRSFGLISGCFSCFASAYARTASIWQSYQSSNSKTHIKNNCVKFTERRPHRHFPWQVFFFSNNSAWFQFHHLHLTHIFRLTRANLCVYIYEQMYLACISPINFLPLCSSFCCYDCSIEICHISSFVTIFFFYFFKFCPGFSFVAVIYFFVFSWQSQNKYAH